MLCKHFASGEAHDATSHSSEHSQLETSESDGRSPQTRGHEQSRGYWHLTGVLETVVMNKVIS